MGGVTCQLIRETGASGNEAPASQWQLPVLLQNQNGSFAVILSFPLLEGTARITGTPCKLQPIAAGVLSWCSCFAYVNSADEVIVFPIVRRRNTMRAGMRRMSCARM